MRISFLNMALLIGSIKLLIASPAGAQDLQHIKVTLDLTHAPLRSVFERIESQTDLLFVYPREVNKYDEVTLAKGTYSVKEALDKALDGTSLAYRKTNNNVVIFVEGEELGQEVEEQGTATVGNDKIVVSGRIVDGTSEPIPGVNVLVQGTTRGTTSDTDGKYSIDVYTHEKLVFTFIGFKTVTAEVGERTIVDVTLEQDAAMLSEVTVSGGYYETTNRLKTGSIVKVTAKDIEHQPVTSPLMALQGRVPGLEITPNSGAPGVAPKIRIRGTNSLRQQGVTPGDDGDGNYPLYVIDGVPVNSAPLTSFTTSFTRQGYDPLSTINPSNIESIEVLKDGDATAIYGSRGANGVILITTKRNLKSSEHTNIDVSVYTGIGQVSRQLKVLGLEEYLSMRREAVSNTRQTAQEADAVDLFLWDTTRHTNWQKVLLGGNAKITDLQAGISSGTKNTSFRFSGGYHKESLIFPGDFGYQRFSGQLSINHTSENQKFKVSLSTTYGLDNSHYFVGDMMSAALKLPPNAPKLYNDDGTLNWETHDYAGLKAQSTWTNPLSYLRSTQDARTNNSISNIGLSYDILPGFTISVNTGYTNISNKEVFRYPRSAYSPGESQISGTSTFIDNERMSWIVEPKASYMKQIGKHRIDVIAGGTWQKNRAQRQNVLGDKYASDAVLGSLKGAGVIRILTDEATEYRYNSVYARFGYNWRERYILNLTGRRDGSSRFGPGNRFGDFGSVGAAWIFSEENFAEHVFSFVNFGKLRASYGITGSDNLGDYRYYNLYTLLEQKYDGLSGIVPSALYNPNYAWEVTKKLEVAVELSFVQNRLGLEIVWYRNKSSNQLVNYPLSAVTGFPSVQTNFDATVQNSGWEAVLRGDLLNSGVWRWNASVNFSLPCNKLVRFDGIDDSPYVSIYKVGEPLSVQWLYTYKGVNKETGVYEFVDENKDGLFNEFDRTIQNLTGTIYYGGITNTVQYKNLDISLLFQFSHQQSQRYLPGLPGTQMNQAVDVLGRWQHGSDETDVQLFSLNYQQNKITDANVMYALLQSSDYNTTDASFIRLKTLSLGYRVSNPWLDKAGLMDARIFIQGQNLLTFTKYEGLDPETGSSLPPLRMITAGVQFKF